MTSEAGTYKIKHILVPTDFSEASQAALEMAASMARRFGARLTLFHAHAVPSYLYPDGMMPVPATVLNELERSIVAELNRLAQSLAAGGMTVEIRHTLGGAAAEICRAADEIGADLIIMGTHGRTGLRHMVLGSVAEKVVRKAAQPVLTVRSREQAAHPVA
jgi:nucleotide-binding universal stress UspA family protein